MEEERVQKYTTAMYRAPEMADLYSKQLVNEKVDIWALGCILYTIAFFTHPFQDSGNLAIINGKYRLPDGNVFSFFAFTLHFTFLMRRRKHPQTTLTPAT